MIPQTGTARILFYLLVVLVLAQWLIPLAAYQSLPDRVPVHFDMAGNPDRWASKTGWELWIGPIIATFMAALAIVLLRFPQAFNVPRKAEIAALPPEPRARLHDLMREMILAIFVCVLLLMLAINAMVLRLATSSGGSPSFALIILAMVVPLAVVLVYMVRITRAADEAKREAGMS